MDPLHSLFAPARAPADTNTLLILLHGLGSNEQDLFALADELDPRLSVASLRAPRSCSYGGYAWFDVAWTDEGVEIDASQALSSLEVLASMIQTMQARHAVSARQTLLGGFSQGAMMSLGILLKRPDLLGGSMLLSGALVPDFVGEEARIEVPVFQSHGVLDPVLPIHLGRQV
ncbi:MAG TPA: hypothetical protein VGE01_12885, partial [Fimbriimonas sp.]